MLAYSEVIEEGDEQDKEKLGIRMKNLKKFMLCVLKLALQSSPEIILDYPIDKLATATAEKCFEFAGVTDRAKGVVSLEQITRYINGAN